MLIFLIKMVTGSYYKTKYFILLIDIILISLDCALFSASDIKICTTVTYS